MNQLTKEQKIVLTGYTGINFCEKFSQFHEDVEKRMERSVFTHELPSLREKLKELYKDDFMFICGCE